MSKLRRIDIERSQDLHEKIGEYVQRLVKELDPSLILLHGSFPRGDIHEASDIDILVVADFQEDFLDRIKLLAALNSFKIPVEAVGYRPEELEGMLKKGNRFIQEAIRTGKVLYRKKEP